MWRLHCNYIAKNLVIFITSASLHAGGAFPPFAEVLFSGLFQGANGSNNPLSSFGRLSTSRVAARNGNRENNVSALSENGPPVVVSVRQTSYIQGRAPASSTIRFFMNDSDDDEDEEGRMFPIPASMIRNGTTSITRFRIGLEPAPSSSTAAVARSRTVDLASSPQRSYAVSGQGSADMPLEIADSDEEAL